MAVFLVNICKFNGCGITFPSLGDLIQHIEDTHIDYDPSAIEKQELQQPSCLPLSCILRLFTESTHKDNGETPRKRIRTQTFSTTSSVRSGTPTGSEQDDEEVLTDSEDSNESWTRQQDVSSEFILSRMLGSVAPGEEKPFLCPVPGCKRRYKNVNGIKYHAKNGHRKDARIKKAYKCYCGKSYKTSKGLKNHTATQHSDHSLLSSFGTSETNGTTTFIQSSPATAIKSVAIPTSTAMTPAAIATPTLLAALSGDIRRQINATTSPTSTAATHLPILTSALMKGSSISLPKLGSTLCSDLAAAKILSGSTLVATAAGLSVAASNTPTIATIKSSPSPVGAATTTPTNSNSSSPIPVTITLASPPNQPPPPQIGRALKLQSPLPNFTPTPPLTPNSSSSGTLSP